MVSIGNRHSPVTAKCPGRDLNSWRGLTPLVFGGVNPVDHPSHYPGIMTQSDDRFGPHVSFDIRLENSVEHRIWRQRVLVGLIRPQLGRRRSRDNILWNY